MVDDQSLESQMEKLLDDDGEVRRKAMRKIYKILMLKLQKQFQTIYQII